MVLGLILAGALQSWGQTAWTNAVNGVWSDATKWSNGVPNYNAALLRAGSGSYTVTVDGVLSTLPTALTITNNHGNTTRLDIDAAGFVVSNGVMTFGRGSLVSVNPGGVMTYPGTNTTYPIVSVENGGEWRVNGGTVNFTDLMPGTGGRDYIYIGNASTGRLSISSGLFDFRARKDNTATNRNFVLTVGNGTDARGSMVMTGGRAVIFVDSGGGNDGLILANGLRAYGELLLTNDAFMVVSNWITIGVNGGTGIVTVAGNATNRFTGRNRYGTAGSRAEINVRDNGYFYDGGGASLGAYNGGNGGTGILNVAGGRYHADGGISMNSCGANQVPYSELNVSGGVVEFGPGYGYGLNIGDTRGTNAFPRAVVNISGTGLLKFNDMWNSAGNGMNGVIVGRAKAAAPFSSSYGRVNMSGGAITNRGQYLVGVWSGGTGEVYQTGGDVWQRVFSLTVGWGGGTGVYHMAGGTFLSDRPVFVGGIRTNELGYPPPSDEFTNSPAGSSAGTLKITGGDFRTTSNLVVGVWGNGTLTMGSNGLLQVGTLLLTNNGSSTLRFEFGPNGIGTLTVTNQLQIAAGAKLQVDMTGFKEQGWFKLVNCKTRAGSFDMANITVTGGAGEVVQTRDEDIYLRLTRGTLIYVK
jgi:hypothetical protein